MPSTTMAFIQDYLRDLHRKHAREEADRFLREGKYAEAAGVYQRMAEEILPHNELIYASDCHDAFRMWLRAKRSAEAVEPARSALRVLSDTDWLGNSSDAVDDLCQMVTELHAAG